MSEFDDEEYKSICYNNLPIHIITNILSFLVVSDFKNACQTSKAWFEASRDQEITKKIAVTFERKFSQSDEKITEIMTGRRYFSKVTFKFIAFKEDFDEFWIHFGKYITEIKFSRCEIEQNQFFHLLQFLPNLISLTLENTSESINDLTLFDNKTEVEKYKIKKCLSSIDTLEFLNLSNLTDEIFEKFISFTNNIKSFTLYSCFIVRPSSVIEFCKKHEESLISLKISHYNFNQEEFMKGLITLDKLKLKCFKYLIYSCSNETIDIFFMKQNILERLNIEGLSNEGMKSVCKYLRKLKYLKADNCYEVKDALADINELTKIEVLQLIGIGNESDEVLLEMLKDEKPVLRELQLFHPITNKSMTKISENCPNLESLDLRFMHPIPQRGAQMIFKNLTNLTSLQFRKNSPSTGDDVEDECEFLGYSISNLSKLTSLIILGIENIVGVTNEEKAKLKFLKEEDEKILQRRKRFFLLSLNRMY